MAPAKPLDGVTVIEFGHSVAAPYAGMILADLGARVIKVENPGGGDYARGWGPPFWQDTSTSFHSLNRGKDGITVDFADPTQAEALRRLILEEADAVIQNLRPGALIRFGLDAETMRALKPGLIWCDIGAFGASGPLKDKPGYDPLMQAFSGLMSVTGTGDGAPVRVGVSLVDMGSGMWAVIGLLAALLERARSGTGTQISASLYETSLAWMTVPLAGYAGTGDIRRPHGSGVAEIVPYQAFLASDGWLMIAAGNDGLFRKFCTALGAPEIGDDPDYATNAGRVGRRGALVPRLEALIAPWTVADLAAALDAVGVPNAPLQAVDQVIDHPQTVALDMISPCEGDDLALAGTPLAFDGVRPRSSRPAPSLGEHDAAFREKLRAHAGD